MATHDEILRETLALTFQDGFGPRSFKKLLETHAGLSGAFLSLSNDIKKILMEKADAEMEKAAKKNVRILGFFDENYPADLKNIYDPPIVLYVKGNLPPNGSLNIGIVGSRTASLYGMKHAKNIAFDLASAGICVVSGMALGIDSAAHEGVLKANGVTLAVLGNGLGSIYPPSNKKLAEQIIERGALVSEYAMDKEAFPAHFPCRNRIISGLSKAVLVVEAAKKSGALITADQALEQGRDVYAMPGNADSIRSEGTNALIKQGAKLVTSAQDILDELGLRVANVVKDRPILSEEEARIISFFGVDAVNAEEIMEKCDLPANRVLCLLSELEVKGVLRESPGRNFSLKSING